MIKLETEVQEPMLSICEGPRSISEGGVSEEVSDESYFEAKQLTQIMRKKGYISPDTRVLVARTKHGYRTKFK